jgi:hypothetical protein
MQALVHAHSGLRWLVLLSILAAIIVSIINSQSSEIQKKQKIVYLIGLIFSHTQLLIGIVLYYTSNKVVFTSETMGDNIARFFTVEHSLGMILAIILITIGYSKSKKMQSHRKIALFYSIALLLIIVSIPWPFRDLGVSNWF